MSWRFCAVALLAVLVGCGGGGDGNDEGDVSRSRTLTAEERVYAAEIVSATLPDDTFTASELQCASEGMVRAFGLARAKELDLAGDGSAKLSRADAETQVTVLEGCVDLAAVLVRATLEELKDTSTDAARCAPLLDKSKVREFFLQISMDEQGSDIEQQLQADMTAALPKCRK